MRILFLSNNDVARPLFQWLLEMGETVFWHEEKLNSENPALDETDLVISYNYRHLIKENVLSRVKWKAINLHTSFLPWNRGDNPNLWSFLENTPKGVTLHRIDAGMDTGPIFAQEKVDINESKETLKSSYELLHRKIQNLFKENWPKLGTFSDTLFRSQTPGGSVHFKKDFERIKSLLEPEGWDVPIDTLKRRYDNYLNGQS